MVTLPFSLFKRCVKVLFDECDEDHRLKHISSHNEAALNYWCLSRIC